ncbi:MAG TPA: threonine-phosphate decarboxylase CobD [Candidatus Nitrosotalea sp.]|nr:threonine-phosphate decarboxylase CobD [Candidatus Nitrosotalea sp.]
MRLGVPRSVASRRAVAHGGIYSSGLDYDPRILDFSSNVNPLGFPPSVRKNLAKHSALFSIYPDPDSTALRKALQKYTGIPKDQITVGNGATEIIYNFCKAFLKGRRVLIPAPTFGEYESAARLEGARVSFFETMDLNRDIERFVGEIPKSHCVFVCNPNNPTGTLTSRKNMERILKASRRNSVLVFVDECFIELSNPSGTVAPKTRTFDNLFVLRSLTKSFGLAGLRVGYGIGSRRMIEMLNRIKIPWNVSGIAQNIATSALSSRSHLPSSRRLIAGERRFLRESISAMGGFHCYDSDANFILVKTEMPPKVLQKKLMKKNILIRDCSSFRGLRGSFIRIAVRTRPENKKLVGELGKIWQKR